MKSYFNFNRKEKIGVTVLTGLILVLTVVLNVGSSTYVPDPFDVDKSELEFLNLANNENTSEQSGNEWNESDRSRNKPSYQLKNFDPNIIGLDDWINMGFSQKQAESINNYRENYGPFRRKEDLHKLYVISDEKYTEIEPYIQLSENQQTYDKKEQGFTDEEIELKPVKLNFASKDELMEISGIGPAYADRIIKYRNKIGGFVDPEQIQVLYISDEAKSALNESCIIDSEGIRKTKVNSASKNDLRAIPYSNWSVVAMILKKRDVVKITDLNFLTEKEISPEDKEKFSLYIDFD